jgi:hypothetical protein
MTATINIDESVFTDAYLAVFAKTVSRTPVTKTTSNATGDEILTDGTPENIPATLFRRETNWAMENSGLIEGADAIMLFLSTQAMVKDDKITYDSETYRVDKVVQRRLGTTSIMKTAQLFRI